MKKDYGQQLSFTVAVEGIPKCKVGLKMPNTTFLKEVAIQLCKVLDLDRFNTTINFFSSSRPEPLSEIMSLRQMRLPNGGVLVARVKSTRCPSKLEYSLAQSLKYSFRDSIFGKEKDDDEDEGVKAACAEQKIFAGLTVHCICENKRCPAYQLPKFVSRGFGNFGIASIVHGNSCLLCPNNDINQRRMRVISIMMKHCSWKMHGLIQMPDGVINEETYHNEAFRVEKTDSTVLQRIMSRGKWLDEVLTVRPLIQKADGVSNLRLSTTGFL